MTSSRQPEPLSKQAMEVPEHIRCRGDLVWAGGPVPGVWLSDIERTMTSGHCVMLTIVVAWNIGAVIGRAPLFPFIVYGVLWLALTLYLAIFRLLIDARRRSRTTYWLTPESLVMDSPFKAFGRIVHLSAVHHMEVIDRRGSIGTIVLGARQRVTFFNQGEVWGTELLSHIIPQGPPKLEFIQDVDAVFEVLRAAVAKNKSWK